MRKLNISKQDKSENIKDKTQTIRVKSILEAFEHIVELAENSNLDDDFFTKASSCIRYASRKLGLTSMQVVLLAMFVDRSEDRRIMMSEMAKYTGCRTTKFLRLADDIDILEQRRYIRASRGRDSLSYRVPAPVLAALRANVPYTHVEEPVMDTQEFFDRFDQYLSEMSAGELTYSELCNLIADILEEIKDTTFARNLARLDLEGEDRMLFLFMAHLFVRDDDDNIGFHDIEELYDLREIPSWVRREFRSRSSDLFEKKLIENVNEDGMARTDAFKLTDSAKQDLLGELNLQAFAKSDKGLVMAASLAEKRLIYNSAEAGQIAELTSILSAERFSQVQTRLEKAGMRKGFCCIFYGAPGTGKTETVYQLARRTGRDIMRVDVDKIKSCWVGESEKNIKALFDRYRNICSSRELAPILLFNEADAVLGVRMEGASRAVDKMENSIQNIILQEMESLDGIMIATTNLTTNLDKAFERRFLYKIRFEKPTAESRAIIWKEMLHGLSDSDAALLAKRFDLSGGEIENISRKHTVNSILAGKDEIVIDDIIDSCLNERLDNSNRSRIGF
ncbi:MAG: AAA family ATPase [Barnesiella sp.]|nr:AAA family ATPase [Barnesiella sp.]MBD5343973.1 AAA family ATPase [Bacteroides sp.]